MLNFNDEYLTFERDGKKHEVKKPSQLEINQYNKDLKACAKSPDKAELVLESFLSSLGLDTEIYKGLNNSQARVLIKELFDQEKN